MPSKYTYIKRIIKLDQRYLVEDLMRWRLRDLASHLAMIKQQEKKALEKTKEDNKK